MVQRKRLLNWSFQTKVTDGHCSEVMVNVNDLRLKLKLFI